MRVVIAGAGVIGCSVAYYLSRKGIGATLIERCAPACAASGKSGGFLARDWCTGQAQDALARASFDLHADLAATLPVDYGYRRIDTFAVATSARRALGRRDSDARSLPAWLDGDCRLQQRLGDPSSTAQLHPARFTRALLDAALAAGASLRLAELEEVEVTAGRVTGVRAGGVHVATDALVIAMGPWSVLAARWLPVPAVYGLKGYSITLRPPAPAAPAALFLDHEDEAGERHGPEVVVRPDGEVYLCGFSDDSPVPLSPAEVQVDDTACDRLQAIAARLSSLFDGAQISARQACYRPICRDAMPVLGRAQGVDGAFIATGHNCWGILNAPASGFALAELIAEGASSQIDLAPFDPARLAPLRRG